MSVEQRFPPVFIWMAIPQILWVIRPRLIATRICASAVSVTRTEDEMKSVIDFGGRPALSRVWLLSSKNY